MRAESNPELEANPELKPQKPSNNIPIIIVVGMIAACCCCTVLLCLTAGVGVFMFNERAENNFPPIDSFKPMPPDGSEDWLELPTEIPQEWMETPDPMEPDSLLFPTVPANEPYDPDIPQGGRSDNELRKQVWDFITSLAEDNANCQNPLPAAAIIVVTEEPDSAGIWEEGWTLFCENGSTPVYRVIFTPNSDGTINFSPGLISK